MATYMAEIRRESPVPLYYQVFQIIQREIDLGKYGPGETIPTEMELQNRFSVSRATIRQALSELVNLGVLERRRSKGTMVTVNHVETLLKNISSFTNEIMEQDLKLTTSILEFKTIPCPVHVADQLLISDNEPVHEMTRLRNVDTNPVACEKWYAPVKLFPNLKKSDFGQDGLEQSTYFVLHEKFNTRITRALDTVSATSVEGRISKLLGQVPGSPILLRTRVSFNSDGLPVTYASGYYIIKLKFALGE